MIDPQSVRNPLGERLDLAYHPGDRPEVLVILGHGVTGNKDRPLLVALAEGLSALGWSCLRMSFSGNGESEGRFEESCITKEIDDLKAVLDAIPENVRIAYAGHSMGGAVGVMTAADDSRIRVLVSLAGMTHTAGFVAREFGDVVPDAGLMWDEPDCPLSSTFVNDLNGIGDTLVFAGRVRCPWLLIHGGDDDVVPVADGEDAYQASNAGKQWVLIPGAGHSFGEDSFPQVVEVMDRWFAAHLE